MILNKKIIVNYLKRRKGDVPYLICNPSRALKLLKWKAKMSSIKQIIMDDIKWNLYLKKIRSSDNFLPYQILIFVNILKNFFWKRCIDIYNL